MAAASQQATCTFLLPRFCSDRARRPAGNARSIALSVGGRVCIPTLLGSPSLAFGRHAHACCMNAPHMDGRPSRLNHEVLITKVRLYALGLVLEGYETNYTRNERNPELSGPFLGATQDAWRGCGWVRGAFWSSVKAMQPTNTSWASRVSDRCIVHCLQALWLFHGAVFQERWRRRILWPFLDLRGLCGAFMQVLPGGWRWEAIVGLGVPGRCFVGSTGSG